MKTKKRNTTPKDTPKDPRADPKFRPDFYAKSYEYSRNGLSVTKIAEALGVPYTRFLRWYKYDEYLRASVQAGRAVDTAASGGETFVDYVYERLSPELKEVWDRIADPINKDMPGEAVEDLLRNKGDRFRQHLFVHALVVSNFNPSEACKKTNIAKSTLDRWCREEAGFADLVREVLWHEKNFIKGAFFKGIAAGEPSLIKIAVQARLKDEGYGAEVNVNHTGGVLHGHVTLDEVLDDLPLEEKKKALERLRAKREAAPVVRPSALGN